MKKWSTLKKLIWLWGASEGSGSSDPLNTFTGAIVRFLAKKSKPIVKLEANFTPIQDLNGYDAPWPPGGGKNKFDKSTATANTYINSGGGTSGSSGWTVSDYIVASENTTYTLSGSGAIGTAAYTAFYNASKGVISTVVNTQTTFTTPTGTAYIRISMPSANINTTQLELGSTATAFAPYSNICPISGHTGCDVWDDPKHGGSIMWNQMFDGTGQRTSDGITTEYDSENNAIKITNNSRTSNYSSGSTRASVIDSTELVTDHKYYCKLYPDITGLIIVYSNSNTPLNGTIFAYNSTTWISLRVTKDYDFVTAHPVGDVTEVQLNFFDLTEMFGAGNEPTTVEEFEALFPKDYYEPQVTPIETCVSAVNGDPYEKVSISFGQTVYSGTLDVVSGELTLTHGIITANGTESWTKPDNCFKTESLHADSDYPQGISNTYTVGTSYSAVNGNNNRIAAHSTWFRIHDERFSTTDALKTYLSENNVQFVYELATPVTIPLTASQINTLAGENNVWVNAATGDITVQAYGAPVGASSPIVGAGQAGHMII